VIHIHMGEGMMKSMALAGLVFACLIGPVGTAVAGGTEIRFLANTANPDLKLPFSEAVQVGDLLFLSGQLGMKPGARELVPGGIKAETRQTLENIKDTLERHGSSLSRVVKCTVFLADIAEWALMNEVYVEYFPENPPARSALGSSGLAMGARTEIECIAVVGP